MRKRTIKKQIWINQTEDNLLKAKAKKSGLNESDFLRSCIKFFLITLFFIFTLFLFRLRFYICYYHFDYNIYYICQVRKNKGKVSERNVDKKR